MRATRKSERKQGLRPLTEEEITRGADPRPAESEAEVPGAVPNENCLSATPGTEPIDYRQAISSPDAQVRSLWVFKRWGLKGRILLLVRPFRQLV